MPTQKYRWYQLLVQKIASTPPGAAMMAFLLHHFDKRVFQWTKGRTTLASILAGLPVIMLTSTGAKSGIQRTVPLLGIPDPESDGVFAVIASNWGQKSYPAWYHNLKAHPRATCSRDNTSKEYEAHEAEGVEYEKFWEQATRVYPGYANYRKRVGNRHIPIIVLQPLSN